MFATMLVKVDGKTVAKTVQDVEVEALVHTWWPRQLLTN